ncbi:hypothetical protein GCM10025867_16450 [Frondihabitans sucicola]|uniref:GH29D-like beta-sandwich domain-containing protein n=1 Tax=Frondihabitans sucicola TaxID=1268041 RepID=A0ABM8GLW0_9MICO|nr:chitobiase/beta-hexosaminidase C-terminal domain-containing protein [Frondihabitans sucicola]BDZ49404.1 hypothetical protein GCM10025867_16450 [Frondihabitans sucicola]
MKVRSLSLAISAVLVTAVALPASAHAVGVGASHSPSTAPSASRATTALAAAPTACGAGTANPTSNNVTDYHLDTNVVAPGRWSYQSLDSDTPGLLAKGGTGAFAADEWAADLNKPEHAWYVKADGSIGTDYRPIADVYTVPDTADGKTEHVSGTFTSPGGRFRVLLAHDGDGTATTGPFSELYSYTGTSASFDLDVKVAKGDDVIFVSDQVSTWWVAGKLNATVTTEVAAPTAPVTATPGAGSITTGKKVALASKTPGACISYTTDGTDPRTSATKTTYAKPITITADTDIKAVAVAGDGAPSPVADLPFTLSEPFRSFAGENQASLDGLVGNVSWDRQDFDWGTIEPTKGVIDKAALAKYVAQFTEAKAHGITILPVLDYTAGWAANRTGYTYEFHGTTYIYGAVTSEANGTFTRPLTTKDSHGKILTTTATAQTNIGHTPPQDPKDFAKFVQLAVDTLKPLGITYYQVWNEAYPGSGFWEGGMDEYMHDIQLPASKVLHDNGVKLVYGGWIAGAPISEYIALLTKWNAWKSVDVFDMHYMPIGAMQTVYAAAQKHGIKHPAVWQTELGFTPEDKFVADIFPRVFHWALSKGGSNPDQFKLFYFADWAPNDPAAFGYNQALKSGDSLSPKGKTLVTLADLLRGTKATTYDTFTTSPGLKPDINESASTANGFELDGKHVVLAIDLKRQNQANIFFDQNTGDTLHLDFGTPMMTVTFKDVHDVKSLDRVDLYGNKTPLTWKNLGHGTVQAQVPIIDADPTVKTLNRSENEDIFYLSLQQG